MKGEKRIASLRLLGAEHGSALQQIRPRPFISGTFHPRMAWIYRTGQETVGGGAGWVRGGLRGMDAADKPYLMEIWQRRCREPAWAAV